MRSLRRSLENPEIRTKTVVLIEVGVNLVFERQVVRQIFTVERRQHAARTVILKTVANQSKDLPGHRLREFS